MRLHQTDARPSDAQTTESSNSPIPNWSIVHTHETSSEMRQDRSFTERRKHDIQPCRLSLGTSAFRSGTFGSSRPVADVPSNKKVAYVRSAKLASEHGKWSSKAKAVQPVGLKLLAHGFVFHDRPVIQRNRRGPVRLGSVAYQSQLFDCCGRSFVCADWSSLNRQIVSVTQLAPALGQYFRPCETLGQSAFGPWSGCPDPTPCGPIQQPDISGAATGLALVELVAT